MITFKFNPTKTLQAVRWMLSQTPQLDFHTILKAVYFADRESLNAHGRPVFGARYRAMNFGPVPLEVYEMLKLEPYWLSELQTDHYPWCTQGYHVKNATDEPLDLSHLSRFDRECLESGFRRSSALSFSARTRETHGRDWIRAELGMMRYEDMIDDDVPDRDRLIDRLEVMGPRLAI